MFYIFEQQYKKVGKNPMQKYQLVQQIGHGAYSIVFKAINKQNNSIVAIKRINHQNSQISIVLNRQIRTLKTLHHPNIITLLQIFADSSFTYLVFEYLPYDLITYYKELKKTQNRNLSDDEITYITMQMCKALHYMNMNGIMHRDIKPQNVLIDPKTLMIKIIDFGFATPIQSYNGQHTQYMITRWYRPLQIVLGLGYDATADVFALGALVMELYQGQEIFRSASNVDQMYWVLDICGYPSTWPQAIIKMSQLGIVYNAKKQPQLKKMVHKLRSQAADLITQMLQTNPSERITLQQILNHKYFSHYQQPSMKQFNSKSSNILTKSHRQIENLVITNTTHIPREKLVNNVTNNGYENPQYQQPQQQQPQQQNYYKNYQQQQQQQQPTSLYMTPHHTNTQSNPILKLDLKGVGPVQKNANLQSSTERLKQTKETQIQNPPLSQRRVSSYLAELQKQKHSQSNPMLYSVNNVNNGASHRQHHQINKYVQQSSKPDKIKEVILVEDPDREYRHKTQGHESSRRKAGVSNIQNFNLVSTTKNMQSQEQLLNSESKTLKNRTKSFQGINVMSLKRNNSNTNVQGNPQLYLYQQTPVSQKKQDLNGYLQYISSSATSKKQATFTKIRDKLTHENFNGNIANMNQNKAVGKIKISLTDRHQFQHSNPQNNYYQNGQNIYANGFYQQGQVRTPASNHAYEKIGWPFNFS